MNQVTTDIHMSLLRSYTFSSDERVKTAFHVQHQALKTKKLSLRSRARHAIAVQHWWLNEIARETIKNARTWAVADEWANQPNSSRPRIASAVERAWQSGERMVGKATNITASTVHSTHAVSGWHSRTHTVPWDLTNLTGRLADRPDSNGKH